MKLDDIKSPKDVYQFMEENIGYGWIDINGNKHLNTMNVNVNRKMYNFDKTLMYNFD